MKKSIKRAASWLSILAVLAAALAPAMSRALSSWQGPHVAKVEICTIQGSSLVTVQDDRNPAAPSPGERRFTVEHCPFCLTHAGSFGLPPAPVVSLARLDGADPMPPLFLHSPRPLLTWAAAQPRAPPLAT